MRRLLRRRLSRPYVSFVGAFRPTAVGAIRKKSYGKPQKTCVANFRFCKRLQNPIFACSGMMPAESDIALLETARRCEFYGIKFHQAKDVEGTAVSLTVLHLGLKVYHQLYCVNTFSWAKVRKLCFKRKHFLVKLHPETYMTIRFVRTWSSSYKIFKKQVTVKGRYLLLPVGGVVTCDVLVMSEEGVVVTVLLGVTDIVKVISVERVSHDTAVLQARSSLKFEQGTPLPVAGTTMLRIRTCIPPGIH
ncbi:hypothetical protein M514_20048 [Trichuris suis]|uniref:FERM domain-containing protein n=1 Tax=Trichuris suis TaxID=68888 RepID=A0A085NE57_9BILA|nr:hypothetical protein M514_20048 [Trichuris suis]